LDLALDRFKDWSRLLLVSQIGFAQIAQKVGETQNNPNASPGRESHNGGAI
jgi:hypothetical protein